MNSIVAFAERRKIALVAFGVAALALLVLTPDIASAQTAFQDSQALSAIRAQVSPFIRLGRTLAIIYLAVKAVIEAVQAGTGGDGKWSKVGIMTITAFFLISPSTILTAIFGTGGAFGQLSQWGL